jgi:hypothetical protein
MAQQNDSDFPFFEEDNYLGWLLSTTRHFCVLLNTLLELRMLYSKHARRLQWMRLWILQFLMLLCLQQSVQLLSAAKMIELLKTTFVFQLS